MRTNVNAKFRATMSNAKQDGELCHMTVTLRCGKSFRGQLIAATDDEATLDMGEEVHGGHGHVSLRMEEVASIEVTWPE